MGAKLLGRWCAAALMSTVSVTAAAADLRLIEAIKKADHVAVRALIEQGLDVNTPEGDGATALHWAAYRNDLESADLLLRAGANAKAADDEGVTPLWVACPGGSQALVGRLLEAGAIRTSASPRVKRL